MNSVKWFRNIQKLINVLKNKIFNVIYLNLFNNVEFLLNNLLNNNTSNQYFNVIFKVQQAARNIVKSIVISTFEELDNEFKESAYRKSRYYINKSNVPRTLIAIVGEITFYRTYYISKHSNKKFFYIDKIFDLPKCDHYDPIVLLKLSLYLKLRVENILQTAYNCQHRQIVFTIPEQLRKYFFFPFERRIHILFKAVRNTIYSILNDYFKKNKKGLLKKYSKGGFYVYAEPKKFKSLKSGIEYVTRYCGRVPISENRIVNYGGSNVTFSYIDHNDNKYKEVSISASEFIMILLRHLLPSQFKIIYVLLFFIPFLLICITFLLYEKEI